MKNIAIAFLGILLCSVMAGANAQEARPYKEGAVTIVTFIKTKPGKFDEYMHFMATTGKAVREDQKKAGLLLAYGVYAASPRTPKDHDIILTMTYPNMAALDKDEEAEALAAKSMGNRATRNKAAAEREALREVLGTEMIRELVLK